jgi:hypothetical protein
MNASQVVIKFDAQMSASFGSGFKKKNSGLKLSSYREIVGSYGDKYEDGYL